MLDIKKLEETIGYTFRNANLLRQAICHSSYANEHSRMGWKDNERLEFLGDAVLELASSDYLFRHYPSMPEGEMTKLRASLVCEPALAMCAREIGLPDYLLLGHGEEITGGRERNSIISDCLESVIGAIYLDGGMRHARAFILDHVLNDIERKQLFSDSKTILQEMVQSGGNSGKIVYELVGEEGPDHAKRFRVEVVIDGVCEGVGSGSTKKAAEQEAAYHAIIAWKEKMNVSEKH